ncbi:MAG TPA: hypothetical protein ENJ17_04345 [Gammaproteobacteria bacterium]|nr:hypothetical protein [Gammaproteobacteria bacterium]
MTRHPSKPLSSTATHRPPSLFNRPRLFTGLAALALGALLYLLERPAARTYFIPRTLAEMLQPDGGAGLFGALGQQLPTFLHTFSLCLLTAALLRVGWRGALGICGAWLVTDALFELGQQTTTAEWLARHVPAWFQHVPVLDNTASYFLHGRFDPLDLLSIVLGAAAAFVLILATRRFDPSSGGAANGV